MLKQRKAAAAHTCIRRAAQEGDLAGAGYLDAYGLQRGQEVLQPVRARRVRDPVSHASVPHRHHAGCGLQLLRGQSWAPVRQH